MSTEKYDFYKKIRYLRIKIAINKHKPSILIKQYLDMVKEYNQKYEGRLLEDYRNGLNDEEYKEWSNRMRKNYRKMMEDKKTDEARLYKRVMEQKKRKENPVRTRESVQIKNLKKRLRFQGDKPSERSILRLVRLVMQYNDKYSLKGEFRVGIDWMKHATKTSEEYREINKVYRAKYRKNKREKDKEKLERQKVRIIKFQNNERV